MYDSIKETWQLIHRLEYQGFRKQDILTILRKVTRDYEEGNNNE